MAVVISVGVIKRVSFVAMKRRGRFCHEQNIKDAIFQV